MLQRLVSEFLAVLKTEVLEGFGAGARLRVDAGEVPDPVVGDLPAAAQVQRLNLLQAPGDEEEAGVGDLGAAAQLEGVQVLAVGGDPAQAAVCHLLAEAEVENLQTDDVLVESRVKGGVGQVVAAGEIEALQVGDSIDQFS